MNDFQGGRTDRLEQDTYNLNQARSILMRLFLDKPDPTMFKWNDLAEEYDNKVYSITKFPHKRRRIVDSINPHERIVIAGCGSATYLQRDLVDLEGIKIVAYDFSPEMLKVSRESFSHPHLQYSLLDTQKLPFSDEIDKIISTNSIVPSSRAEVIAMYLSIHRALKQDGELIAYFPSFSSLSIMAQEMPQLLDLYKSKVDFDELRFNDTVGWQCWQTKESILKELVEAGFNRNKINIEAIGCESEEEGAALAQLYSMDQDFISQYFECFFVTARK